MTWWLKKLTESAWRTKDRDGGVFPVLVLVRNIDTGSFVDRVGLINRRGASHVEAQNPVRAMADDERGEDATSAEYARQRSSGYSRSVLDDLMAEDDDFHDLDEEELYDGLNDEIEEAGRLADPEPADDDRTTTQVLEEPKEQVGNGVSGQEAPKARPPPTRVHETRSVDVKPLRETYSTRPDRNGDARFQHERPWPGPQRPPYNKAPKRGIRYFIIKSVSHRNIATSIEKGVWATQAINEAKLNQAFETAESVILVFSVNQSGHFQGYARMASPIGRSRSSQWSENEGGGGPWGGDFAVEWLQLYDLAFNKTLHLRNPLNEMKPIKISRDGQELPAEIGEVVCALMDEGAESEGRGGKRPIEAGEYKTKDIGLPDEEPPFEPPIPGPASGRGFGRGGPPRPSGRGFGRPPFIDGPGPRPGFGPAFREGPGFRPHFMPRGYREGPYMDGPMVPPLFGRGLPYLEGPPFPDGPGFGPPFRAPFEEVPPFAGNGFGEAPFPPWGGPPYRDSTAYGAELPGFREGYVRRRPEGSPPARGRSRSRSPMGGYSEEERPRRSKRRSPSPHSSRRSRSPKKEKRKKSKRRSESPPPKSRSKKASPPPEDLLNMSYEEYLARVTGGAGGYPVEGAYPGDYGRLPYGGPEDMYGPEAYYRSQGYWQGAEGPGGYGRRPL